MEIISTMLIILFLLVSLVPFINIISNTYSWFKEEHTIHQIKHKKSVDPFFKKAMEELDDMDRLVGLLPPKPLPAPKSIPSYSRNHYYSKVSSSPFEALTPIQQEFIKRKRANDQLKEMALYAHRDYLSKYKCVICDMQGIHTHSDVPF